MDAQSAAVGPDGRIYVFGGTNTSGNNNYLTAVYAYDIAANSWSTVAPLPVGMNSGAAATGPDGRLYVVGGSTAAGQSAAVWAYSAGDDAWYPAASLPVTLMRAAAVAGQDGKLYVIGGVNGSTYRATVYTLQVK